jgi:tRNA pseudouridine55 synthase
LPPVDGVLLIDKPAGKTSHDIVAAVRRELRGDDRSRPRPKVGHAGTLDPFATGLLLVLVGRATRAQRFFMNLPKTYETVARFGAVSTTGDTEGEITERGVAEVPEPLDLPVGPLTQRPPAYSAIKIGGERAYRLARRGEEVEMPERTVTIHACEERWRDGPRAGIHIECSSGTYVRSLVADLGDAYCEELRRTAIGPFDVADAGEGIDVARMRPLGDALGRVLPVVELDDDAAWRAAHGQTIDGEGQGATLLVDRDGPVAIAEPRDGGKLKPIVGFRSA